MNPAHLMNIPCTITPRTEGAADEYNDVPLEDGSPVNTVCWLHQTASDEQLVGAVTATQTWTIYLPAGTVIDAVDAVTVLGVTYELTGPPAVWTHPRSGDTQLIAASMRQVA